MSMFFQEELKIENPKVNLQMLYRDFTSSMKTVTLDTKIQNALCTL